MNKYIYILVCALLNVYLWSATAYAYLKWGAAPAIVVATVVLAAGYYFVSRVKPWVRW